MMSIKRLGVGAGYKYLLNSTPAHDVPHTNDSPNLAPPDCETGTPPGIFLGSGLKGLNSGRGVEVGQVVTAKNLQRMMQHCSDPFSGEALGRAPSANGVACFDLTFSPSKSISVAWALGDRDTRRIIYQCHLRAIMTVLVSAEREVFRTRSRTGLRIEEEIEGVIAASFTRFDSRAGDPQLRDHVLVWNRVQAACDGRWRTLDSRRLFASSVTLSEMHQGILSDLLTSRLGWNWERQARRSSSAPKWEVAGVFTALMEEFSQRTTDIDAATEPLVHDFEVSRGRVPTNVEVTRLRQRATLETRPKRLRRSLSELTADWIARAIPYVGEAPNAWVLKLGSKAVATSTRNDFTNGQLHELATTTFEIVSSKRTKLSRSNLEAEVFRQLHSVRFTKPSERLDVATRVSKFAIGKAFASAALLRNRPF